MNIILWILQGLLAVHTAIGAIWKFSNTAEQTMPTLAAIPESLWLGLSGLEILCAIGLLLPAVLKKFWFTAPVAAGLIATEMLMFCALHRVSGSGEMGPMIYWLVVAAICAVIVYGRLGRAGSPN